MFEFQNPTQPLRIGCGAGFSGDRTDAAAPVVQDLVNGLQTVGGSAVLIFETLAERTLALAQFQLVRIQSGAPLSVTRHWSSSLKLSATNSRASDENLASFWL
jgi:hypothetical protein